MHTRRRYYEAEAVAVIARVRDFIQPLIKQDAKREINKRVRKLRAVQQFSGQPALSLSQRITLQALIGKETKKKAEGT